MIYRPGEILVTESAAQATVNAVAVLLALSLPRLVVLLKFLTPSLSYVIKKCRVLLVSVKRIAFRLVFRNKRTERLARREFSDDLLHQVNVEMPERVLRLGGRRVRDTDEESDDFDLRVMLAHSIEDDRSRRHRLFIGIEESITLPHSFGEIIRRLVNDHLAMGQVRLPGGEQAQREHVFAKMWANFRDDAWAFAWISGIVFLVFLIVIGEQLIAISTYSIITDSAALITSPRCGVWLSTLYSQPKIRFNYPEEDKHPPPPKFYSNLASERAMRAISYVDTCYTDEVRDNECSHLYTPRIPFDEDHNATCPFSNGTCLYGDNGAYSVDTGYLDSGLLGFNHPVRCEFRIRSTCSPILPAEPYIRSEPGKEPGSREVSYYFGRFSPGGKDDPNWTLTFTFPAQTKDYFRRLLFRDRQHSIERYPPQVADPWNALRAYRNIRSEFQVPNAFSSIYLISSTTYYAAPSDDPIFPAVVGTGISSDFGQVCWNNLQRHSVLACANSFSIRHPRTGALWYPNISEDKELETPEWNDPPVVQSVTLLNLSLAIPDHYMGTYSFQTRQFGIHNRESILSGPIPFGYWKSEVQRLFKIKLARLQLDVVGVAQGMAHDLPGAENELAKRGQAEACWHIKFQEQDYNNLSLVGLIGFLSLNFLVWLFTIRFGDQVAVAWLTHSCLIPGLQKTVGNARLVLLTLGRAKRKVLRCFRTSVISRPRREQL